METVCIRIYASAIALNAFLSATTNPERSFVRFSVSCSLRAVSDGSAGSVRLSLKESPPTPPFSTSSSSLLSTVASSQLNRRSGAPES